MELAISVGLLFIMGISAIASQSVQKARETIIYLKWFMVTYGDLFVLGLLILANWGLY